MTSRDYGTNGNNETNGIIENFCLFRYFRLFRNLSSTWQGGFACTLTLPKVRNRPCVDGEKRALLSCGLLSVRQPPSLHSPRSQAPDISNPGNAQLAIAKLRKVMPAPAWQDRSEQCGQRMNFLNSRPAPFITAHLKNTSPSIQEMASLFLSGTRLVSTGQSPMSLRHRSITGSGPENMHGVTSGERNPGNWWSFPSPGM